VRARFSCRECETITQPPAPFHVTPRGFAGPNLLAMILFEKRAKLSRHNAVAKAIDYMLTRWPAFVRFLEDGRHLLDEQCGGTSAARLGLGPKIMALRRLRARG
jgi:hypothetical protein